MKASHFKIVMFFLLWWEYGAGLRGGVRGSIMTSTSGHGRSSRANGFLNNVLADKKAVDFWTRIFDAMYEGTGPNTWDYQWVYTCWTRNWVSIVPSRNLIQNIGFGLDATHTCGVDAGLALTAKSISFPLRHPPSVSTSSAHAMRLQRRFYTPGLLSRIRRKLLKQIGLDAD